MYMCYGRNCSFLANRPSFSKTIKNVEYDLSEMVNAAHPAWNNVMSNILTPPPEERKYRKQGAGSGFNLFMFPEQKHTA